MGVRETEVPRRRVLLGRRGLRLPRGWPDAVLQAALWALADLLYEGVRGIVAGRAGIAFADTRSLISLEKSTGTFWEPHVQSWVLGHREVIEVINWIYLNAQFSVNLFFLAALYVWRNEIFYFVRNMYFVAMGLALVIHLGFPVAPPRLFPEYGFVDTVQRYAHINQDVGAISLFVNPYAAVPSMHMCFALLVGGTTIRLTRRRWLQVIGGLYPVLVLFAIVATGNHFILDAAAGAVVAIVAAFAAHRVMARMRPDAWAWGQRQPATAIQAGPVTAADAA
jgi:membrane-associated phospholipid phosphatase